MCSSRKGGVSRLNSRMVTHIWNVEVNLRLKEILSPTRQKWETRGVPKRTQKTRHPKFPTVLSYHASHSPIFVPLPISCSRELFSLPSSTKSFWPSTHRSLPLFLTPLPQESTHFTKPLSFPESLYFRSFFCFKSYSQVKDTKVWRRPSHKELKVRKSTHRKQSLQLY